MPLSPRLLRPLRTPLLAAVLLMGIQVEAFGQGMSIEGVWGTGAKGLERKPFAEFSASAVSLKDSLSALSRAQIGRRYKLGGQSPERGFDCSGLVKYIMAALGVELPRTAAQQATVGVAVPKDTSRLRPGDLLTFGKGSRISHIAIYLGEGKYVHASTGSGKVIETTLDRPRSSLLKQWRGVRRVVDVAQSEPQ